MFLKRTALLLGLCTLIICQQGLGAQAADVKLVSDTGSAKVIRGETLINAPVESVWNNLTNYANMKNVLPGYERSTVLQSSGDGKTIDLALKASPLLPAFHYQMKARENKGAYQINLTRISGDFKSIDATYKLISIDGGNRTRMVYTLSIDLGNTPALGAGQILKSSTEKGLNAMQAHCNRTYQRSLAANAAH